MKGVPHLSDLRITVLLYIEVVTKKWVEILLHAAFWLFSFWMLNLNFALETQEVFYIDGIRHDVISRSYQYTAVVMSSLFGKILLAYGNIGWAMPLFLKTRKWIPYAGRVTLLMAICLLAEILLVYVISSFNPHVSLYGWIQIWQFTLLLYLLYFGISVAYVLGKQWQRNEHVRRQLQEEKITAELNFLKSQINPHFLFNTLNNLYALATRTDNDELTKGIAGLSELLRYVLYECRADRVALEKEVHFIEAIIEMQHLRLGQEDDVTIVFNTKGAMHNRQIAPMILLPFVENACKHGIRWQEPSFIKISLEVNEAALQFEVINSLHPNSGNMHAAASGIGLENVRRRLKLIYPETHQLEIREQEDTFAIDLTLYL